MQYHTTHIMIHRPFISVSHHAPIPFPSLAICTNAARSLTRLTEVLHKRRQDQVGVLTWTVSHSVFCACEGRSRNIVRQCWCSDARRAWSSSLRPFQARPKASDGGHRVAHIYSTTRRGPLAMGWTPGVRIRFHMQYWLMLTADGSGTCSSR